MSQAVAQQSYTELCDVIGVHPYGHSSLTIETYIYDAPHINPDPASTSVGAARLYYKKAYCSEIGYPGAGMDYQDSIHYARNVQQRDENGGVVVGVGYCPWSMMSPEYRF